MFSGVAGGALVPILIPGGIGRIVAELVPADDSNAAPPRAIFARSLRAGWSAASFDFDSGAFICESPFIKTPRAMY